jgi:hypothetical protein
VLVRCKETGGKFIGSKHATSTDVFTKCATGSGAFGQNATGSGTFGQNATGSGASALHECQRRAVIRIFGVLQFSLLFLIILI